MVTAAKCGEEPQKEKFPARLSNFRITNKKISKRNSKPTLPLHRRLVPHTYCYQYYYPNILVFVTNLLFRCRLGVHENCRKQLQHFASSQCLLTAELKAVIQKQNVSIHKCYLRTKFQVATFNTSCVVVIKARAKENICIVVLVSHSTKI